MSGYALVGAGLLDHIRTLAQAAVLELYNMICSACEGSIEKKALYDKVSEVEMKADELRRQMIVKLTERDVFPQERQDLMELVRAIDWVADWAREAGRILVIIPFEKVPEEMKEGITLGRRAFLILRSPSETLTFPLLKKTTVLGRLHTNDVVLEDPNVSRVHAEIKLEKDGYAIRDLGSTNGTRVNNYPIPPHLPFALNSGDEIKLGNLLIHVFFEG